MDDWLSKMTAKQTDFEVRMTAEHRCVTCGGAVEKRGPRKNGTWIWPRHCWECAKLRCAPDERNYGPARASIHHELARRTGYSGCQAGGPDMRETGEEE